jgi:hypothetical protein
MVDIFALALSHGLLALAAIRLLSRPDLDDESADSGRKLTPRARREMRVRRSDEPAKQPDA